MSSSDPSSDAARSYEPDMSDMDSTPPSFLCSTALSGSMFIAAYNVKLSMKDRLNNLERL